MGGVKIPKTDMMKKEIHGPQANGPNQRATDHAFPVALPPR